MKRLINNKQKRININEEKGAASALVLFTVLMFIIILMGSYMIVTSIKKGQLESDIRIQEIYKQEVNEVDDIFYNIIDNYDENEIYNQITE